MARWRLSCRALYQHERYFVWEYSEVDRTTGRPKRTQFPVPRLLNPEDPGDWNYIYSKDGFGKPDTGEIIVAQGDHEARDYIFEGEVTPDMVPLDDEAKKISAASAHKWKYKAENLNGTYADEMMKDLNRGRGRDSGEVGSGQAEGMTELLTAMTAMMKQESGHPRGVGCVEGCSCFCPDREEVSDGFPTRSRPGRLVSAIRPALAWTEHRLGKLT